MTIKALIIEDEAASRNALQKLLQNHCEDLEFPCRTDLDTVKKAVAAIRKHRPHVVFLDIRLSDTDELENGFHILKLVKDVDFELVFVTAYDQAVQAFNDDARTCYYVLKPYDIERLKEAVSRVKKNLFDKLCREMQGQNFSKVFGKVALPTQSGFEFVPFSKIVAVQGDGSSMRIYQWLEFKFRLVSHNLRWMEKQLDGEAAAIFFRPHNSFIVNKDYVREFQHQGKKGLLMLHNGMEIPVAEDRKSEVLERLRRGA